MDEETAYSWIDFQSLLLLGMVVILLLVARLLNPEAQDSAAPLCRAPSVIAEIRWADGINTDVDLWSKGPDDVAVGYSNLNGKLFNLLRDDLGHRTDLGDLNYEMSCTRGLMPGEYIVNAHLYSNYSGSYPVEVSARITLLQGSGARTEFIRSVTLSRVGDEQTFIRFTLNANNGLIVESVHDTPYKLRALQGTMYQ